MSSIGEVKGELAQFLSNMVPAAKGGIQKAMEEIDAAIAALRRTLEDSNAPETEAVIAQLQAMRDQLEQIGQGFAPVEQHIEQYSVRI
jgi:hypothetical protein